jgi:hypothetical protein
LVVALLWVGCWTEDTLFESVKQFAGQLQAKRREAHF